jgi:hypothetical protein
MDLFLLGHDGFPLRIADDGTWTRLERDGTETPIEPRWTAAAELTEAEALSWWKNHPVQEDVTASMLGKAFVLGGLPPRGKG